MAYEHSRVPFFMTYGWWAEGHKEGMLASAVSDVGTGKPKTTGKPAARNDSAAVQICSIQTLRAREWQDLPQVDWWIVDESHKEPAAYEKLFECYPNAKVLGLTATPVGPQGRTLIGLYDEIVEPIKNVQLIREKFLLPTKVWYASEPDTKGVSVNSGTGDYSQEQLGKRVEGCTSFADVFKWWEPYQDCQTLAFVPRVVYAHGLAEQFREHGHKARVIEGGTTRTERQDIVHAFNEGVIRVLVSVDVLKEGFDAPVAQVGIDLQPTKQLRTFWQKIGRLKRPHEGQDKAVWLDFAGNVWNYPHPDENPEWPTEGETTQEVIEQRREQEDRQPWACAHCGYSLSPGERLNDGRCPSCSQRVVKPIRRVRMLDGTMKTLPAGHIKKKQKTDEEKSRAAWTVIARNVGNKGGTLNGARFAYRKSTGKWPNSRVLPFCPEYGSGDWSRKVYAVYPDLQKG